MEWLFDPQTAPIIWTGLSVVSYIVAAHVAWSRRRAPSGRKLLWTWPISDALPELSPWQLLRAVYALGPPYLALITGIVPPRALGLQAPDGHLAVPALALALGTGVTVLVIWSHYARSVRGMLHAVPTPLSRQAGMLHTTWGWALILRDVLFAQAHWAFYRATLITILRDTYGGTLLSLVLLLLESLTNPSVRRALQTPGHADGVLVYASQCLVTALLFLLTGDLWWGLGWHLATAVGVPLLIHRLTRQLST